MAVEVGDDLVNHRGDRTTAAIHDALAADLHYIYPRQNCEIGRGLGCTLISASLSDPSTRRLPSSLRIGLAVVSCIAAVLPT